MLKTGLAALVASAALLAPTSALAVVGGSPVPASAAPWAVQISSGSDVCTGTIVAPGVVLTDAHCVTNAGTRTPDPAGVSVNFPSITATVNTNDPFIPQQVAQILVEPDYNPATITNDVALIQLNETEYSGAYAPTVYSQPTVELATSAADSSLYSPLTQATVAGWGATSGTSGSVGGLAPELQEAPLQIQNNGYCQGFATESGWGLTLDPATQFCAQGASSTPAAICRGDSGGPLFETIAGQPVEIGLADFGAVGCPAASPSYFTSVLGQASWLAAEVRSLSWSNPSVPSSNTTGPASTPTPSRAGTAKQPLAAAVTRVCQRVRAPRHPLRTVCVKVGRAQFVRLDRFARTVVVFGTTHARRLRLKSTTGQRSSRIITARATKGHWTVTLTPGNGWLLTATGTDLSFIAAAWDAP